MDCLDLLKEKELRVQDLPKDVQKLIRQYAIGIEKVKEAEKLNLSEDEISSLNDKVQGLSEIDSEITNAINEYIAACEVKAESTPVKKRGRPKASKKVEEPPVVAEQKPAAKRGRKTKSEVVINKTSESTPVEKDVPVERKKVVKKVPERRRRSSVPIVPMRKSTLSEEDKIIMSAPYKKDGVDMYLESSMSDNDEEFFPLDIAQEQEVQKLQEEIAGEFDKIEQNNVKKSNRKRKIFWGAGIVVGAAIAAICGVNFIKE